MGLGRIATDKGYLSKKHPGEMHGGLLAQPKISILVYLLPRQLQLVLSAYTGMETEQRNHYYSSRGWQLVFQLLEHKGERIDYQSLGNPGIYISRCNLIHLASYSRKLCWFQSTWHLIKQEAAPKSLHIDYECP